MGVTAGPAHCDSQDGTGNRAVITGYETEISEDGGPWRPLHDYDRPRWYDGSKWFKSEMTYRPTMVKFTGNLGITYRVRSRGIASYHDPTKYVSEWERTTTSWSPATEFTVSDQPPDGAGNTDYDTDDDGLIEVSILAQLNAIRWDADGNGIPDLLAFKADYDAVFPDATAGMGCPSSGCVGYELTTALDFDTNDNGQADAGDSYWSGGRGWMPLGLLDVDGFAAVFDGSGHVIRNLYINTGDNNTGLFGKVADTGVIRDVGLESVNVTSNGEGVGGLVGMNGGVINNSYVTGTVTGATAVGGLVGGSVGVIMDSYSTATVTGTQDSLHYGAVGGLVGNNVGKILGSYATGRVSGKANLVGGLVGWHHYSLTPYRRGLIKASYATGDVSGEGRSIGGLVGKNEGDIEVSYAMGAVTATTPAAGLDTTKAGRMRQTYGSAHLGGLVGELGVATASYWNTDSSGLSASASGTGKTAAELVTPTGYVAIYADWNVDLDGDGTPDDPWDFGTDGQYPVLKRAGPGVAAQRRRMPTVPAPTQKSGTFSISATASAVEGTEAPLTITLSKEAPADGVAFTVTVNDSAAVSNDVGSIPSLVTVTAGHKTLDITIPTVDDDADEDDETFTVTLTAVTTGWEKAGEGQDTATVTITDNDTAGVTVTAGNPLPVAEGGTGTYTVALDSQPTADVTITPISGDTGAARVSPASHTFTPSSWNTAATFTVSGVADADTNDETVDISHSVTSQDVIYGSVSVSTVRVLVSDATQQQQQQVADSGPEPANVQVVPGDGTLTVSWTVTPREGVANNEIRHALRWSQVPGVWHNPRDPRAGGAEDGLTVAGGVASYVITGLTNGVTTGVFVRSFTGDNHSEGSAHSSQWVRTKGAHTTPTAARQQQQQTTNRAPTVARAINDVTLVHESGAASASLAGVFNDADSDSLTLTATSSADAVATVSVSADYSTLTVTAKSRGTATITVTANDGNGGTVADTFTVTVKAAPTVASALADVSGLAVGATQDVALAGVFGDADGDSLTLTATSSNNAIATVSTAADSSKLTVAGVVQGTATVTVTAKDSDGNRISDDFDVTVVAAAQPQAQQQQQQTTNRAPTVASALGDVTIVTESGTREVSLNGVFNDADDDDLTVTAVSSADAVATVSVSSDYRHGVHATLTVTAKSRGTATITVTANDGNGGTVADTFTVTVKAAPTVASALADVSGLAVGATQDVALAGVFGDADGDSLTVTATSSNNAIATVSTAADSSKLTVAGVVQGTATVTVTAEDSDGNRISDDFDVTVVAAAQPQAQQQQQQTTNRAPTVASALGDVTIVTESGTREVSLNGVFNDADSDSLTLTAASSADAVATVSVSADYSTLTVTAKSRGTATITVTANDGNEGTVSDSFTVTVKAGPTVSSPIGDVSSLEVGDTQDVSLSGVFRDADGDALTITANDGNGKATVTVASDQSKLTVTGVAEGTATITVTARDSDGNEVRDAFDVSVNKAPEPEPVNRAPTVASALGDVTIVTESGTREVSLNGVFRDADSDALTVTAKSSADAVATVSVASDGSTLTVAGPEPGDGDHHGHGQRRQRRHGGGYVHRDGEGRADGGRGSGRRERLDCGCHRRTCP